MKRALIALAVAVAMVLVAAGPAPAANPHTTTTTTPTPPAPTGPLVLYDSTGPYGWLGELYATEVTNLAGHFGSPVAHPVSTYTAGELNRYPAVVYVGSTYDEPIPSAFLDDVLASTKPVVWMYDNIWALTGRDPSFSTDYGWMWSQFDTSTVTSANYKGTSLTRSSANQGGIMNYSSLDTTKATVLADAVRADGSTFPWAVRSRNLTYLGEVPFTYANETDRQIIFSDLLFDALAPGTPQRHRALVRLEDINPTSDPTQLRAAADWLSSQGVAFGFGVSPRYLDPTGYYNNGVAEDVGLKASAVADAIRYLQSKGGVLVEHGYTHQWDGGINPYTKVTGDDYEFYRVTENTDHSLNYVGPLPGDSATWASGRVDASNQEFKAAKITQPTIFEFPHYSASAVDYRAISPRFSARWERALYFGGVLSGGTVDYSHMVGQFFPYVVKDVYGAKVLPENLGDVSPDPWFIYPARLPANIVDAAQKNLVIRDGFASFFFHPYLDISYLQQSVAGLKAAGYTFVSPSSL
jgi:uncharacterized protein YdaL